MPRPAPDDEPTAPDQPLMVPQSTTVDSSSFTYPEPSNPNLPRARMSVSAWSTEYDMDLKNRGRVVIFNHEKFDNSKLTRRAGSSVDVAALMSTFRMLGFEPTVHHDLTRSEISDELQKLAGADHNDSSCLCIIVLTHGKAPDLLHARDRDYRQCELWDPFISSECLSLAGKPKLFFIQACRGVEKEKHVVLLRDGVASGTCIDASPNDWSYVIPSRVDFLISHSTCAGYCSHRHPVDGTWFIQSLCDVLTAEHATKDLLSMLTTVHRTVVVKYESYVEGRPDLSGLKETPSFTSTLMREVRFRPKLATDSSEESDAEGSEGQKS